MAEKIPGVPITAEWKIEVTQEMLKIDPKGVWDADRLCESIMEPGSDIASVRSLLLDLKRHGAMERVSRGKYQFTQLVLMKKEETPADIKATTTIDDIPYTFQGHKVTRGELEYLRVLQHAVDKANAKVKEAEAFRDSKQEQVDVILNMFQFRDISDDQEWHSEEVPEASPPKKGKKGKKRQPGPNAPIPDIHPSSSFVTKKSTLAQKKKASKSKKSKSSSGAPTAPRRKAIMEILKGSEMSTADLMKALKKKKMKYSRSSLATALTEMSKGGFVRKGSKRGYWIS